jgi:cytochrome b
MPESSATRPTRVWDLPTRLFHWVLAATIVGSVVSAKIGGNAMEWHYRFGYVVFTLLAFRLLWGFVGGRWSRFGSFVYAPWTVLRYLRNGSRHGEHHDVGHSPLGSLSVLALLLFLAAQVATGLVADDEIANQGPLYPLVSNAVAYAATSYHKAIGQWVLLGLVTLHVGAVLWYLYGRKNNLIVPMLDGDKALPAGVPPSADTLATRLHAAVLLVGCALVVSWVVSLGST